MTKLATSLADVLPAEALVPSAGDGTGPAARRPPEAEVHPETTAEVAATLGWAAAQGVGVLPMASGARLRSAALDRPYVLLRTDRLRGIELYEPADLTLTARAGTPLAELAERLGAHRQWLPFDPPHVGERSLGGLVATGESGPVWMGYGELRNHVLGVTVVTGDGRTLRLGGRVVKNVAGFDLLKPMVGSRGRLAVITSVCVRAFPVPAEDRLLVLRADSAADLVDAARAVGTAPVLPVSCVILSPARALGAGSALLVRLHGSLPTVDADQRTLERHCGVTFERPADAARVHAEARDAASRGPVGLVVSTLPSRLAGALAAVAESLGGAPGSVELVADTYLGRVRVAADAIELERVGTLWTAVEGMGGSLSVRSPAGGGVTVGNESLHPRSRGVAELVAGLERVFDPSSVLWPCRS
ncbi:MAG TPA: FAD-binding oxidoreductase [Longimicrobiales bacterium]|nr:FAD-binding oxidoreductase [Longimicrobiales bacterium]